MYMAYRNIFVVNKSEIHIKNNHLVIDNGDCLSIPISDIKSLVFENPHSRISAYDLTVLSENNVTMIFCDKKHMPFANVVSPFDIHNKKALLEKQILCPEKDSIWQAIVKQKIINQAQNLKNNGLCGDDIEKIALEVLTGDKSFREAVAAKKYFRALFGDEFNRRNGSELNSALNYGYSVIRSEISKALVTHGFEPSVGIHHDNQFNNFNLSDDIIECFRPIVDNFVYNNSSRILNSFDIGVRAEEVLLLNEFVLYNNKRYQVSSAIDAVVSSLKNAILNDLNSFNLIELERK